MLKKRKFKKSYLYGYLFIAPPIIGFLLFQFVPMITSFVISFTDYNFFEPMKFVGLENYANVFRDELFSQSMGNTALALLGVPIQIGVALLVAVLLSTNIKGQPIYRTMFFIPGLCSSVAISLVWKWLFNKDFGILNNILGFFHIPAVNWLGDSKVVMFSMILQGVWIGMGSGMLMYVAALKGVSQELYEAAEVEGASKWYRFRKITLPLISPTTFYLLIMGIISWTQDFSRYQLMTNGGPNNASLMPVLYVYQAAFFYPDLGYSFASALSWILGIAIFILIGLAFISQRKWVHYNE